MLYRLLPQEVEQLDSAHVLGWSGQVAGCTSSESLGIERNHKDSLGITRNHEESIGTTRNHKES